LGAAITAAAEVLRLTRENAYLKTRCAQLQGDLTDVGSQLLRAQQQLERLHGARVARAATPSPEGP
jgi:hypothetical protein